ncbi:hypothetical protein [Shewanella youngdeokensis]|uniref:Uncharacterized protein n=1 Tax=Shewanella youngdeokensis TaxID=2999068 RepID=A0ABZ0K3X8_9GAMM|nr:hypothetical protein RGE70_07785 [Shewanella sp. DAU334]
MRQINRAITPFFSVISGAVKGTAAYDCLDNLQSNNESLVIKADKSLKLSSNQQLLAPLFTINTIAQLTSTVDESVEVVHGGKRETKSALFSRRGLLLVVLLHVLLIGSINQFGGRLPLKVTAVTPIKIQSYLYVAPNKRALEAVVDSTSRSKISDISIFEDKPVATLSGTDLKVEIDKTLESKPSTNDVLEVAGLKVEAHKLIEASQRREGANNKTANAMAFTRSYLQRKNDAALDTLIVDKANEYTGYSSISEIDNDMVELIFPEVNEYSKIPITDHRLDPNRIVRQGDTCYRIVKTPTPINPYAENIGFPFNCGGDKVHEAINDAISARLEKRMITSKKH